MELFLNYGEACGEATKFSMRRNKKILVYGPSSNFLIPKNRIFKIIISLIYLLFKILFSKKFLILSFQSNIFAIIVSTIFNFKIIIRANSSPTIWAKNKFKKNIFTFFFRKADAIIVNSYDLQKEFRKKFKFTVMIIDYLINYR